MDSTAPAPDLSTLSDAMVQELIDSALADAPRGGASGLLPTYELRHVSMVGAAIATANVVASAGDDEEEFTLMSAVKPFLLLYLLETIGEERVFALVDQQYSDQPFYSVAQLLADGRRPRSPMLNSGAMLLADQLPGGNPSTQCENFAAWLNALTGTDYRLDAATFDYMMKIEDTENARLARELQLAGASKDAGAMLDVYFRLCCLAGTVRDLALLGRSLAFAHPMLTPARQATTRHNMAVCGMYEASPAWATRTGLPAKSGVSGCILAVAENQGALAAFSPVLDRSGNPLLSQFILTEAARQLRLGVFS